ncbi:MAG: hypothetical protein EA362_03295 [Saprospirales bacterium]|nr:MAG: hypothetical protein EA362_03295 [Saprospirales bacterium]
MTEKHKTQSKNKSDFPLWEPDKDLTISSFKSSKTSDSRPPLSVDSENDGWSILQTFKRGQNNLILAALNQGVDAIELALESADSDEFNQLMKGVKAEMISLHLNCSNGSALVESFHTLRAYLIKKNIDIHFVEGSLRYVGQQPFSWLAKDINEAMPRFSFYYFESSDAKTVRGHVEQLGDLFINLLRTLENAPFEPEQVLKKSIFRIHTGNDFLTEVAKIRAFYRIWDLILNELDLDHFLPDMEVSVAPEAFGGDLYFNLIRSTSAAVSAAISGGTKIHLPFIETNQKNAPNNTVAFLSRMHANILHLIQHESHLHRVSDPLAGSYLIEELTDKLAERIWEKVRENF